MGRFAPAEKLRSAAEIYPCEVLLIHRDAEGNALSDRHLEIAAAVAEARLEGIATVPVVPVRMMEAGNPNGRADLELPSLDRLEGLSDPKAELYEVLTVASELSGRRRRTFNPAERAHRVAELIEDFSPLLELSAFRRFAEDLGPALAGFR